MKDLISIADLSPSDAKKMIELGLKVKKHPRRYAEAFQGEKFGLIFEKPSTRTWVSFDVGLSSMGGSTVYLGPDDIKLGVREATRDVARVLDRYLSGVVLRTFAHETITEFQKYFTKPVINGLSDVEHPCQALADYLTILEYCGSLKKPLMTFVGDGNNVLHSLVLLAAKLGGRIHYATPKRNEPCANIIAQARGIARKTGAVIQGFNDPLKAVRGADAIYTDVWISMGEEHLRKQKMKAFKGMQVNRKLLSATGRKTIVMHCLPAHRGEEITDEVLESPQSVVFDQAENRLHAQKAVMLWLGGKI